ncbi:copper transporter [Nonomuraea sp. NBC_00507]|uniref:copper transporter n=1 Tax=Nonomuraea sp. NBC_00507 TaxID=2976002 RepID=UPI002E172DD7
MIPRRLDQAENDTFIASIAPERVAEVLVGERVLLVEAPDAKPAEREAIQEALIQAGADYAGQVTLTNAYLDQQRLDKLDMLVNGLMPDDMTIDPAATTYEKGAMLLSATLLTSDPDQAGTRNEETLTVLDEFERAGLLSIDGEPGKRATIAVMIAPENPFEGENAEAQASAPGLAGSQARCGEPRHCTRWRQYLHRSRRPHRHLARQEPDRRARHNRRHRRYSFRAHYGRLRPARATEWAGWSIRHGRRSLVIPAPDVTLDSIASPVRGLAWPIRFLVGGSVWVLTCLRDVSMSWRAAP